jgi:hypothetical protein
MINYHLTLLESTLKGLLGLTCQLGWRTSRAGDTDRNSGVVSRTPSESVPMFFSCLVWRSCSIDDVELTRELDIT